MPEPRARAWLVSAGVLALVLYPLTRGRDYDSFPASTFPMFAHGRPTAVTHVDQILALPARGPGRPVPPRLVANDEVLQAAASLRTAIRRGRKPMAELCRQVAARIADDPDWSDIVRLAIVTSKYDAIQFFAGDTAPLGKPRVRARCKVPAR